MTAFRPTAAPRGRLARVGVVLDARNGPARLREIAAMCDGAGIDVLWIRDQPRSDVADPALDAWSSLMHVSSVVRSARMGIVAILAYRPAGTLAAMAGTLDAAIGGRLELAITIGPPDPDQAGLASADVQSGADLGELERYAARLRDGLSGGTADPERTAPAQLGSTSPQAGGPPIALESLSAHQLDVAARVADDVLLPARNNEDVHAAVARVRAACEHANRAPATMGIALEVPVSIGRTRAEAEARAQGESLFDVVGHPSDVGVFGTLEECQERVVELAHAGISDLRCVLPNSPDIQDVIAQLTAIAVGTVEVLTPGAPRSKDPDPPETWGGRRSRPAAG